MNFVVAPPNHRNDGVPEGDEVDQLMRAYFKAQMPDPWPSFEAPPTSSVLPFVPPRRSTALRGRLALAASIALLAAGGWFLSGKFVVQPVNDVVTVPHTNASAEKGFHFKVGGPTLKGNSDGSIDTIEVPVTPVPER
jgi:hypothetical protein